MLPSPRMHAGASTSLDGLRRGRAPRWVTVSSRSVIACLGHGQPALG
jgi:hypothetical protein